MEQYRIFIGHPAEGTLSVLVATVKGMGHEVIGQTTSALTMIESCKALDPELIISGVQFSDKDGIEALIEISKPDPKPAIVIALSEDLDNVERAMDDHVMAYLIDPVTEDDLRPTIYVVKRRFDQFEELKEEVEDLKGAMAARKIVERAKGILMKKFDLDEEKAYLKLRKMATDKSMKLKDVADLVIAMEVAD